MKYKIRANLSTKSCSDISELEDNWKNYSELMQKGARNTRSCQKVAELPSNRLWKSLTALVQGTL